MTWLPTAERDDVLAVEQALPTFSGELGSRRSGRTSELVLHGSYLPPGGRLGAAIDGAALSRVARATSERFLEEAARRIVQAAAVLSLAS